MIKNAVCACQIKTEAIRKSSHFRYQPHRIGGLAVEVESSKAGCSPLTSSASALPSLRRVQPGCRGGVDPQPAHAGAAHQRDVGGVAGRRPHQNCGSPPSSGAGVGHAGNTCSMRRTSMRLRVRARGVQAHVKAAQLDGAGHAQLVAQARDGALHLVVQQADAGGLVRPQQQQGWRCSLCRGKWAR